MAQGEAVMISNVLSVRAGCSRVAGMPVAAVMGIVLGLSGCQREAEVAAEPPSPDQQSASASVSALNFERVGIGMDASGAIDRASYSKLSPWPGIDTGILYSGCYDPAPLAQESPDQDRCFMTVDVATDPRNPRRLATVFLYDPEASPSPPPDHIVWTAKYPFANLPVRTPCRVDWADPQIAAGRTAPPCWDPGWNTHAHYVQRGPNNILAVNQERYRGGTNRQRGYHGVRFYDVSDPANPRFLSYWEAPPGKPDPETGRYPASRGVHHFNFDGPYLYLGTEYEGFIGQILIILDVSDGSRPREVGKWWIPGQKTPEEDSIRDWVQHENFSWPVVRNEQGLWTKYVGMHYAVAKGNRAYLSYHQAGLVILDIADKSAPKLLSRTDYLVPGAEPDVPNAAACRAAAGGQEAACGNTHTAKLVPGRDDLLVVSDEYFTCPYGHVRFYDIADVTKPRLLSHFLTDQNGACDTAQPRRPADAARFPFRGPSSHLGNAWNSNLYFMAWYGMGVRAIDISDPSKPVEVGHYEYDLGEDYGLSDAKYAGADTYDVIFGPEGYLYVPDGTAGLRVLRYTGPLADGPPPLTAP